MMTRPSKRRSGFASPYGLLISATGALGHPKVFSTEPAGSCRGEVQCQAVLQKRPQHIIERRSYVGAEVLGRRPAWGCWLRIEGLQEHHYYERSNGGDEAQHGEPP